MNGNQRTEARDDMARDKDIIDNATGKSLGMITLFSVDEIETMLRQVRQDERDKAIHELDTYIKDNVKARVWTPTELQQIIIDVLTRGSQPKLPEDKDPQTEDRIDSDSLIDRLTVTGTSKSEPILATRTELRTLISRVRSDELQRHRDLKSKSLREQTVMVDGMAERLYALNSMISAQYIGLGRAPTPNEIVALNTKLGDIILKLRSIAGILRDDITARPKDTGSRAEKLDKTDSETCM